MSDAANDLPDSGEPGVGPPPMGSLPRPAMWPADTVGAPFRGAEEDTATPPSAGRRKLAYAAAAVMIVGVVLFGPAVVLVSWPLAVVGVVVGLVGVVTAWKARIMEDVSVSDSPHGRG